MPARRLPCRARSAGVALLLAVAARPATAQFTVAANSGSAYADAQGAPSWFPPQRDERFYGPTGGAAVAELDLRGFGHLRAVQLDYGLNAVRVEARPGDLSAFAFGTGTRIAVDVENAGPVTSDPLTFEYTINGGRLRLRSFAGSFDGFVASVSVSIFTIAPGRSGFLWAWTQSLRGQGGTVNTGIDFLVDPLGFGTPALSAITFAGDEAFVDIAPFHRAADLGRLSPGGSAFVTYDMDAYVAGPGFGGGGVAALGDPFDVTGSPGSTLLLQGAPIGAVVSAVPEPAAVLLLGVGLATLGASRRAARAVRRRR